MAGAVVASMCTGFNTGDIKMGWLDAGRTTCTEPWCSIPITKGLQLGPAPTLLEHPASCSTSSTVSMAISLLSGSTSSSSSAAPANCMSSMCKPSSAGAAGLKHGLELSDSMQSNSASSMLCSFTPLPATSPAVPSTWHSSAALSEPSPVAPLKRLKLCSTQPPTAAGQQSSPPAVAKSSSLTCPPAPKRPSPPVLLVPLSELGRYVNCS